MARNRSRNVVKTWPFLDEFLMAALNGTVPFAQMNDVSAMVGDDLDLDTAGFEEIPLPVDPVVAKRRFSLRPLMLPRQHLQAISAKHADGKFRIQSEKRSADGARGFRHPAYSHVGWTVKVVDYLVARMLQGS